MLSTPGAYEDIYLAPETPNAQTNDAQLPIEKSKSLKVLGLTYYTRKSVKRLCNTCTSAEVL